MSDEELLAARFEESRAHLRAVAYRMLGSGTDADDAVQQAWLRLSRSDPNEIDNLGGWLTTVVARVCLDMMRSRTLRRETTLDTGLGERLAGPGRPGPEDEALLADAIGPALLVVLDTLAPAERLAFVLHDMFAVPFEEIAPIVERSPTAARQLASRARRRVQGVAPAIDADQGRRRAVVDAFLAASRGGDFAALLTVLAPDVVLRSDAAAVRAGSEPEVRGATAVAATFSGRARAAQPALLDGGVGAMWAPGGTPRVVFAFTFAGETITGIHIRADPEELARLAPVALP
jgi:RNA polymerase sigma factor (sigma-70 family)